MKVSSCLCLLFFFTCRHCRGLFVAYVWAWKYNIYAQIAMIMLIGLLGKNAILM
jgi:multidrug efflux pump subunit AcrB